MTTMELIERGIGHNCLSDAYDLGRADAIDELIDIYNENPDIDAYDLIYLLKHKKEQNNDYTNKKS